MEDIGDIDDIDNIDDTDDTINIEVENDFIIENKVNAENAKNTENTENTKNNNKNNNNINKYQILPTKSPIGKSLSYTYGFIIIRYVNSPTTNRYWNHAVKMLQIYYPQRLIVIIDDNSQQNFLKADKPYKNVTVIQSQYPRRGELLPYIYFAQNKWFDRAVILHDSVFFHRRIPFENIQLPVVTLWGFDKVNNHDHLPTTLKLIKQLKYPKIITNYYLSNKQWVGCFGVQSYISHNFLTYIMNKYQIQNLVNVVTTREQRCSLERIFAVIFHMETKITKNLFGYIRDWSLTFNHYIKTLRKYKKVTGPVVKVFTGR